MAQEAILNVSLKDYKKNIDELRASLLGLEKDSDDYKKIVEELKDKQDKLNEVMSVGKESVNALDGSYNQLSATLSQLKKEWKNMEIGTPEWEEMAIRINDINDKLKDADAQVGVFTRNVGDYYNEFEEGLKQSMIWLSNMPGKVGEIASVTKQLTPLIKQTTNTAVAGLTGVKKAIAATGIGALIVAVGLLITNFDKLEKLFDKYQTGADRLADSTKNLREEIGEAQDELNRLMDLRRTAGDDEEQLLEIERKSLETDRERMASQIEANSLELDMLELRAKNMNALQRWASGINKQIEKLKAEQEEIIKVYDSTLDRIDKIEATQRGNQKKREKEKEKARQDAAKKELDEVNAIVKRVDEASKTEIQKLTEKYEKEKKLLEKYHKDTKALTEQYNKDIAEINEKAIDKITSELMKYQPYTHLNREYRKAVDTLEKFQQVVDRTFPPDAILETEDVTEEMIKKAQELGLVAGNTAQEFAYAWQLAYENFKGTASDFAASMREVSAEYTKTQEQLQKSGNLRGFYENELSMQTQLFNGINTAVKRIKPAFDEFVKNGDNTSQFMKDFEGQSFETTEQAIAYWQQFIEKLEFELNNAGIAMKRADADLRNYEIGVQQALNDAEIATAEFGKDMWAQWVLNTDLFYDTYRKRLDAAIWYRDNLEEIEGETYEERRAREEAAEEEILKIRREYSRKHIEISQEVTNSLVAGWSSMLDRKEALLKQEKVIDAQGNESRKYTDKEIFNQTKSARIAVATIETIQGALAAFMGYQSYPQPYGAILGAAQAAAVTAAGMAQIAQIRATEFNEAGQNISNPQAVINATPRMVDYSPDLVSNLTGASEVDSLRNALQETPIYVSVTDINNAQAKVTDRDKESSF